MEMTSVKDFFNVTLPATIAANRSKFLAVGVILIKVPGEGTWTINLSAASCQPGDHLKKCEEKNWAEVEISSENLQAVAADSSVAMKFYLQGKMKITGDPMLAVKFAKLLG